MTWKPVGSRSFRAAILAGALSAAAVQPAAAGDVRIYNHPNRPKDEMTIRVVRATLIGYDVNAGEIFVSPFVVVRFSGDDELKRVYLTDTTTIDGIPFTCPDQRSVPGGTGFPVCPRLPSALLTKLPVSVQLAIWPDGLYFSKAIILGTDRIMAVALPHP